MPPSPKVGDKTELAVKTAPEPDVIAVRSPSPPPSSPPPPSQPPPTPSSAHNDLDRHPDPVLPPHSRLGSPFAPRNKAPAPRTQPGSRAPLSPRSLGSHFRSLERDAYPTYLGYPTFPAYPASPNQMMGRFHVFGHPHPPPLYAGSGSYNPRANEFVLRARQDPTNGWRSEPTQDGAGRIPRPDESQYGGW
jgi:hypothetical protein